MSNEGIEKFPAKLKVVFIEGEETMGGGKAVVKTGEVLVPMRDTVQVAIDNGSMVVNVARGELYKDTAANRELLSSFVPLIAPRSHYTPPFQNLRKTP